METRWERTDEGEWFVKVASSAEEEARLRHEAAQLHRAAHPGIVELGVFSDTGAVGLRTRRAGRPLAELGALAIPELCGLGAAVATVLGDLHDIGITHGAVDAGHILIGPDGRPVLCGLGHSASTEELDPSIDVRALAAMMTDLLGPAAPARLARNLRKPLTRRRPTSARALAAALGSAGPGARLPSLHATGMATDPSPGDPPADTAPTGPGDVGEPPSAPDPSQRPEMLAADPSRRPATPADPSPHSATPAGPVPAARTSAQSDRRRPRRALAVAGTLVLVTLGGVALVRSMAGGGHRVDSGHEAAGAVSCPLTDAGCGPIPVRNGGFVTPEGSFSVALQRPVVVLGRWTCGPRSLPAALDPRTGQVWVWLTWPGQRNTVTAMAVAVRSGARTLRVLPDTSGCDHLEVIDADGRADVVRPTRAPS